MPNLRTRGFHVVLTVAFVVTLGHSLPASADTVTLKNGIIYRGETDKENGIVTVFDGLKRIVVRDTKVESITSDSIARLETFPIEQPLVVHSGVMPTAIISVKAEPWDEFGRRTFEYMGPKLGKPVRMTQAINSLGPKVVRIRGVDGFWQGHLATSQVPKASVLAILAKIDQKKEGERLKACQFLIQAEWYPEALKELDRLAKDFPDPELGTRIDQARRMVEDLRAREVLAAIEVARKAQSPKSVLSQLRSFPTENVPADVLVTVREQLRRDENQEKADRVLADTVRAAAEALPNETRDALKAPLLEMIEGLSNTPDAVRSRFDAFQAARDEPAITPQARFSRALSGWVVGGKEAVDDLESAQALWSARDVVRGYLISETEAQRADALAKLEELEIHRNTADAELANQSAGTALAAKDTSPVLAKKPQKGTGEKSAENRPGRLQLSEITWLIRLMPPPFRDPKDEVTEKPKRLRVRDDDNAEPTEYVVQLPAEYHPLRRYPTIVALHDGSGPEAAVAWWATEAMRRGYIVIAPEYNLRNKSPDYRYSPSEHAAVELAVRDAKKRFAIDSDRVFLCGQLLGGNMAWDFGLSHPDLFAGVATVSGMPAKYVWAYRDNAKRVPLYIAMGDLIPGETELFFNLGKNLIAHNYDVTYVEYYRRGRENLAEEIPAIFDWTDRRVRDAYPKTFEVVTARSCDDRFFGVVVRDFVTNRTVAPEAVDPLGRNVRPASIKFAAKSLANLVLVDVSGLQNFDVWLGPQHVDLSKRLEVRVNRRAMFRGLVTPEFEPLLEDVRIRGDREQVYWTRVPVRYNAVKRGR